MQNEERDGEFFAELEMKHTRSPKKSKKKIVLPEHIISSGMSLREIRDAIGLPSLKAGKNDRGEEYFGVDTKRNKRSAKENLLFELKKKQRMKAKKKLPSLPKNLLPRDSFVSPDMSLSTIKSSGYRKDGSIPILDYSLKPSVTSHNIPSSHLNSLSTKSEILFSSALESPSFISVQSEPINSPLHGVYSRRIKLSLEIATSPINVETNSKLFISDIPSDSLVFKEEKLAFLHQHNADTDKPLMLTHSDVSLMKKSVDFRADNNVIQSNNEEENYRDFRLKVYPHECEFAIVRLQALWKGYHQHKVYEESRALKRRLAATCIQRSYKYHLRRVKGRLWREREKIRQRVKKESESAVVIQCLVRCFISKRRVNFLREQRRRKNAAIEIQRQARGRKQRLEYKINYQRVIIIQKIIRGFLARCRLRRKQKACIKIQKVQRGRVVRIKIQKWNKCALKIQVLYRGHLGRLKVKLLMAERERQRVRYIASIEIQKIIRRFLARRFANREKLLVMRGEVQYFQAETVYMSNPSDIEALCNFVSFMHATQRKDPSDLIKLYSKALSIAPESPTLNLGYALLLKYLGKKGGKYLKVAKLYDPDFSRWEECERIYFRAALKYNKPLLASSYGTMALIRLTIHNDYGRTAKYFEKAVALDPYDPIIKKHYNYFINKFQKNINEEFFADYLYSTKTNVLCSGINLSIDIYKRGLNFFFKADVPNVNTILPHTKSGLFVKEATVRDFIFRLDRTDLLSVHKIKDLISKLLSMLVIELCAVTPILPSFPVAASGNKKGFEEDEEVDLKEKEKEVGVEGSRTLNIAFVQEPFSPMTQLTPSGHYLMFTIYPQGLDLLMHAINAFANTEYKITFKNEDIIDLIKDKRRWLASRLRPGWRVAAKPMLVQLLRWLDLERKVPPPPPDDLISDLSDATAIKLGYTKKKLAEERKKKAEEMQEMTMLKSLFFEYVSVRVHQSIPLNENVIVSSGAIALNYRVNKPRIRLDDMHLVIIDKEGIKKRALENYSACTIQSIWRGRNGRAQAKEKRRHNAARCIQKKWRRYKAVNYILNLRILYHEYKNAQRIQKNWKGYHMRCIFDVYLKNLFPISNHSKKKRWLSIWKTLSYQRNAYLRYKRTLENPKISDILDSALYLHSFGLNVDLSFPKINKRFVRDEGTLTLINDLYSKAFSLSVSKSNVPLLYSYGLFLFSKELESDPRCDMPSAFFNRPNIIKATELLVSAELLDPQKVRFKVTIESYFKRAFLLHTKSFYTQIQYGLARLLLFDQIAEARDILQQTKCLNLGQKLNVIDNYEILINFVEEKRNKCALIIQNFWRRMKCKLFEKGRIKQLQLNKEVIQNYKADPTNNLSIFSYALMKQAIHFDFALAEKLYLGILEKDDNNFLTHVALGVLYFMIEYQEEDKDGGSNMNENKVNETDVHNSEVVPTFKEEVQHQIDKKDINYFEKGNFHINQGKFVLNNLDWKDQTDRMVEVFMQAATLHLKYKGECQESSLGFLQSALLQHYFLSNLSVAGDFYSKAILCNPANVSATEFYKIFVDAGHLDFKPVEQDKINAKLQIRKEDALLAREKYRVERESKEKERKEKEKEKEKEHLKLMKAERRASIKNEESIRKMQLEEKLRKQQESEERGQKRRSSIVAKTPITSPGSST